MKHFLTFLAAMAVLFGGALSLPTMLGAPNLLTPTEALIGAACIGAAVALLSARKTVQAALLLMVLCLATVSHVQSQAVVTDTEVICMRVGTNRVTWDEQGNLVIIKGLVPSAATTNTGISTTYVVRCASPGQIGTNTNTITIVGGFITGVAVTGP